MESEGTHVVWWAFALGGFAGGAAKVLLDGAFILPRVERLRATGQTVVVPGSIAALLLGPVAAFVMAGAGAGTFDFQGSYDARRVLGALHRQHPGGHGRHTRARAGDEGAPGARREPAPGVLSAEC